MLIKFLNMPCWPTLLILFGSVGLTLILITIILKRLHKLKNKESTILYITGFLIIYLGAGMTGIGHQFDLNILKMLSIMFFIITISICSLILIFIWYIVNVLLDRWLSNKDKD